MRSMYSSRAALDFVGQLLDMVAAAHRVGRAGDAAFVRDDLLRAQGQPRGFFGGQPERFVLGVGVQRLRAAQHRRQRLHRDAHHVDVGLLRGERRSGGLDVKAQHHRAGIARAETLAHDVAHKAAARRGTWRSLPENCCAR